MIFTKVILEDRSDETVLLMDKTYKDMIINFLKKDHFENVISISDYTKEIYSTIELQTSTILSNKLILLSSNNIIEIKRF